MAGNYMILGLCLSLLAGTFLLVLIGYLVSLSKESRCPLYQRRMGKLKLPEAFPDQLRGAYENAGTIEGTLSILEAHYPSGKLNLRLRAAQDYLHHSRYKDWESALGFLSDGSEEMEQVHRDLILLELQKRKRLPDYKNPQKVL